MHPYSILPTRGLGAGTEIAQGFAWRAPSVGLESPALEVMTDLTKMKAATIGLSASLAQCEQTMIYQGVRMLFVVTDMPSIEGLITTTDLEGERPMRVMNQRTLRHDELQVSDVMTPLAQLDAIDHGVMQAACVGDVVATLQKFGRNHLLVVEGGGSAALRVRGVVSRTQVERQLGRAIEMTEIATSFAEIEKALN